VLLEYPGILKAMKIYYPLIIGLLSIGCAQAVDTKQLAAESRAAVEALAVELKTALQSSLKSEGPLKAVAVCNTQAPLLAGKVSAEKSMRVGRTSLKTRNDANAPDAWETAVLEQFEERQAAGEAVTALEYSAITRDNGNRVFRYMKAIPAGDVCLVCHGQHIPDDLSTTLDALYPNDKARGFSKGDIRGAFTVTRAIQ
jgi:hypothetical protein